MSALLVIGASPVAAKPDHGQLLSQATKHLNPNKQPDKLCQTASVVRRKVIKQFGKRTPGRNICKQGLRSGHQPSRGQKVQYLHTLQRMLAPPPAAIATTSTAPAAMTASSGSSVSGVLPSCASESGTNYSTGPDNTNPSGATGRYQEMPEHFQPGGLCYGLNVTIPADQDKCAVLIYRAQGSSAWTGCGGG